MGPLPPAVSVCESACVGPVLGEYDGAMDGAYFPARAYRIGAALLAVGDAGEITIERLSPRELVGRRAKGAFPVGSAVSLRIVGAPLEVGPLRGTVVPSAGEDGLDAPSEPEIVRVAFDALSLLEGRAVLALLEALRASGGLLPEPARVATEVVRDPKRIVAIIRQIFELRCEARVFPRADRTDGTDGTKQDEPGRAEAGLWARPATLLPGSPLPLVWDVEPPCPDAPFGVQITWMNWDFYFRVDESHCQEGRVHTSLPSEIVRVRERFQRRVSAPEGASISFQHPLWPSLTVRQPLHDVSLAGASFSTVVVDDGIFPGLELPLVELAWPPGQVARFRGVVRRVVPATSREAVVAGVSLVPLSEEDARLWRSLVDRLFYPHTSLTLADPEPMWELFDRSGYFNLSGKTTEEFRELRDAFQRVTSRLRRPNDVGVHVVLASEGHAHSAVTMVKPYAHSWLTCQIARRPDTRPDALSERRVLLETMMHGFEYPLRDPGFRWFVSWVQANARWSRWLLHDLAQRYCDDPSEACIVRFRAMEARTDETGPVEGLGDYTVVSASEEERALVLDAIARERPLSYREAHDLVPERVDIRGIEERWRAVGLVRRRHLLVARREGVAVAAGVLDLVEDGVHLFGLLDVLRTFSLVPGGEDAFGAIVEAARAWYRAHGKHKFAYFVEHEDWTHAERAGLKDLGAADLIVISARYMPDQLEHIWEITSPRDNPPLLAARANESAPATSS